MTNKKHCLPRCHSQLHRRRASSHWNGIVHCRHLANSLANALSVTWYARLVKENHGRYSREYAVFGLLNCRFSLLLFENPFQPPFQKRLKACVKISSVHNKSLTLNKFCRQSGKGQKMYELRTVYSHTLLKPARLKLTVVSKRRVRSRFHWKTTVSLGFKLLNKPSPPTAQKRDRISYLTHLASPWVKIGCSQQTMGLHLHLLRAGKENVG